MNKRWTGLTCGSRAARLLNLHCALLMQRWWGIPVKPPGTLTACGRTNSSAQIMHTVFWFFFICLSSADDRKRRSGVKSKLSWGLKYWIQSSQTVEIMCHNLLRWVRYSQYWAHVVPWKKKNNKGDATLKRLSFLLAINFNHNQVCWKHTRSFRPRFKTFKAAAFRK